MSDRIREIEKCDKRLTWLAESLAGVVPWPTEPEVNEWHFEPNEAEFVALATPKRIAALAAAEAREQQLREAMDLLRWKEGVDCWCSHRPFPDHDPGWHTVACRDVRTALAASPTSEEPS